MKSLSNPLPLLKLLAEAEFFTLRRLELTVGRKPGSEGVGAWADSRLFTDGHGHFETADPSLRSLRYIAGGHFHAIGAALDANQV